MKLSYQLQRKLDFRGLCVATLRLALTTMISIVTFSFFLFSSNALLFAAFAPDGVIGSQDNNAPGFQYRKPINKVRALSGPTPSNDWWTGLLVRDDQITVSPYPLVLGFCKNQFPAEQDGWALAVSFKGKGEVQERSGGPIVGYNKVNWKVGSPVQFDFLIWNERLEKGSTTSKLSDFGDWHVKVETSDNSGHAMYSTFAAGSPFVYNEFINGNPRINFNNYGVDIRFYTKDGKRVLNDPNNLRGVHIGDHLIVRLLHPVNQSPRWFGFFAAEKTEWQRLDWTKMVIKLRGKDNIGLSLPLDSPLASPSPLPSLLDASSNYLSMAVINGLEDAELFYEHAYNKIVATKATYSYNEEQATLTTKYEITTSSLRGAQQYADNPPTLTTLFPHQYKHLSASSKLGLHPQGSAEQGVLEDRYYQTIRGKLKLFRGNSFSTVLRNHGILPFFNAPLKSTGYRTAEAIKYLQDEQYVKDYYNVDSYGGGKALLRIAEMIEIADKLGNPLIIPYGGGTAYRSKDAFITSLYNEFADWFTYSPGKEKTWWDGIPHHFMTYFAPENGNFGHLVGWRAGFGTQALNDMHFHFGYWIHAASILARHHPTFVRDYGWAIEEIIRNIASPYRSDNKYPYLRYFSPYMGRSYASGYYWDDNYMGNDQESTSEAMNAWAGVYLWGLATNNKLYRDLGLYLYWTEKSAIDEYWLDVDRETLHPDYPYAHAVILRDTAYDFNTFWGSREIEELYGIQMLPITPATLYLGLNQNYAKRFWKQMTDINRGINGKDFDAWDGILLRFWALIDPQAAIRSFQFGKRYGPPGADWTPIQDHETWTGAYFFLHNMNMLGAPSTEVYADAPSYGVFKKEEIFTFVGYNPDPHEPLTINFKNADGCVIYSMKDIPPLSVLYSR
ncbi:MAG: hypothetical protein HQK53_02460 [Oligoflexia bacterium]|nr:hypothetical protein [Oligoflexia bacterium]